jgi:small subunit ribosomal protein S8
MCANDPLADFLTRIRNASRAGHRYVDVDFSALNQNVAQVLQDQKFIEHFITKEEAGKGTMRLFLRYTPSRRPLISGIERRSTPGRRRYIGVDHIPRVRSGLGLAILSTSQGVISGHEALKRKIGGELLCYVW